MTRKIFLFLAANVIWVSWLMAAQAGPITREAGRHEKIPAWEWCDLALTRIGKKIAKQGGNYGIWIFENDVKQCIKTGKAAPFAPLDDE